MKTNELQCVLIVVSSFLFRYRNLHLGKIIYLIMSSGENTESSKFLVLNNRTIQNMLGIVVFINRIQKQQILRNLLVSHNESVTQPRKRSVNIEVFELQQKKRASNEI